MWMHVKYSTPKQYLQALDVLAHSTRDCNQSRRVYKYEWFVGKTEFKNSVSQTGNVLMG
jgi:hypothetical protein